MTTSLELVLGELRSGFSGRILVPGDAAYVDARVLFNAAIDKWPRAIAQCRSAVDVVRAIRVARDLDLEIAVRGGGHGVAGKALTDGGMVIDLRLLNEVTVDPGARTATAGGGAVMRDLDTTTAPHGLATTGGRVSTTGVGGLTLGGGTGWLDRSLGLVCDNLLEAELVTAEGTVVRAAADENPELFWALHGGGGNFGVATAFTYRLHPVKTMTVALLLCDPAAGPEMIRGFRDFLESAPDTVTGVAKFHTAPDKPFVPPHLIGRRACTALVICAGGRSATRDLIQPMLDLSTGGRHIVEVPYVELQCMLDDPPGYRNHWSADYLDSLPDEAIDAFCARAADMIVPSPSEQVLVPLGGAVARGPADYPVPWRRARWHVFPFGMWADQADDERGMTWARELRADLRPWTSGSVYLNFIGDEGHDRVVAGLGAENYARLVGVKRTFDPDNVFHLNHNIEPV